MLTKESLLEKGFERKVYEDQKDQPVFYAKQFDKLDDVTKLHKHFGESIGEFDFYYEGLYCVVEVEENLSQGQYLFAEKNFSEGYTAHDPLTAKEFENLLEIL
jgi:hypothetical protein